SRVRDPLGPRPAPARPPDLGRRDRGVRALPGRLLVPDLAAAENMKTTVNNAVYAELGARWYDADDDPIALLRAEAALRNPWIASTIERELGPGPRRVLDLGCGGGFLANYLAARGFAVTGVDSAVESLAVAAAHDGTGRVTYRPGDATALDVPAGSFDAVCAMDLLE